METHRYAEATDFYKKSLAIRKKLGDKNGMALIYEEWGVMKRYQHNYKQSLADIDTALNIAKQMQDKYEQGTMLANVSETYLAMKDYSDAIKSGIRGLKLMEGIKFMHGISEMLERLSKAYAGRGDIKKAYDTQVAYIKLQDSLINQKTLHDITLIEFNRVRDENLDLTKNNQLMASQNTSYLARINRYGKVIGTVVVILVLVILLLLVQYRRNLEKQSANQLLIEQKEEIAAINHQLEVSNEEVTSQIELVSEQKDELEKLNNIKNTLFSIISHDLRGPLSSLETLFAVYREGDLGEQELGVLLSQLEDNIMSTRAFLDNLLEWSKGQLEGIVAHPVKFSLDDCIDENIRLWDSKISIKGLTVTHDSAETPVMAFADRDMINLVIRNLLSNAIKFCSPGDQIRLKAEQTGDKALFSIADTGPGISAKDRERLFHLDYTVSTGSQGEHGTHLGLILCQDMATRNNGKLWLETEEGKGATFWMQLPAKEG
jgi:signal transduction histidine kinase